MLYFRSMLSETELVIAASKLVVSVSEIEIFLLIFLLEVTGGLYEVPSAMILATILFYEDQMMTSSTIQ